ncbi:BZ3500_MvSof-1268-A1-R1_C038g00042 [Microbotryum saponariae]|uniref:BZ3500_MvSof-1268-A1-R1_C038g00042 protein n=1 Tax=Microbotryum saponariae TaxID=289078 RepID=A0A2X0L621_9BASI|nr:BZ3500_MvSof-1268-A1-R1_C050g00194 [Microbotryum saponariae]SCZ96898.1 BZ3500_MvSof-1268-A1-R1_Chr4-1g06831 [Microbotryum saponariae]SDA02141.1 BZ3500_MvSof-1268-A1-R1_C038g00042 [Microbotryum saponariae]SDA06488.1 BZ3501_MvSof-1269-A2-R1_Chr4-1g06533 [Microbotryum saponariae]
MQGFKDQTPSGPSGRREVSCWTTARRETYPQGQVLMSEAIRSDEIQVANDGRHAWAMLWMANES